MILNLTKQNSRILFIQSKFYKYTNDFVDLKYNESKFQYDLNYLKELDAKNEIKKWNYIKELILIKGHYKK